MLDTHDVIEIRGKGKTLLSLSTSISCPHSFSVPAAKRTFFDRRTSRRLYDFSYYPRCTSSEKDISDRRLMVFHIFPVVPAAKMTFLIDA